MATAAQSVKEKNPHGIERVAPSTYFVLDETVRLASYEDDACTCGVGNGCEHIRLARVYKMHHSEDETGWHVGETAIWDCDRNLPGGVQKGSAVLVSVSAVFASITGLPARIRIDYVRGRDLYQYSVGVENLRHIEDDSEGTKAEASTGGGSRPT